MSIFRVIFKIVEDKKCPLYSLDDEFVLSDKALGPPRGKPACLILAREMTELLFALISLDPQKRDTEKIYSCSGCSGLIKLKIVNSESTSPPATHASLEEVLGASVPSDLVEDVKNIPLFKELENANFANILPRFTYKKFMPGTEILRKGEKAGFVVILLSGKVSVLDGDLNIATLGRGEVLGEMSQIANQELCASVRAIETTGALCINGADLKKVMDENPSLYMYFLRLFTARLTKSNTARLQDIASSMSGTMDEMPQVELFQIFHLNSKTGVLTLDLSHGEASVSFRNGGVVRASYAGEEGEKAMHKIIAEKEGGRFKFDAGLSPEEMAADEIADFMKIVMEGLRLVDERESPEDEEIEIEI